MYLFFLCSTSSTVLLLPRTTYSVVQLRALYFLFRCTTCSAILPFPLCYMLLFNMCITHDCSLWHTSLPKQRHLQPFKPVLHLWRVAHRKVLPEWVIYLRRDECSMQDNIVITERRFIYFVGDLRYIWHTLPPYKPSWWTNILWMLVT